MFLRNKKDEITATFWTVPEEQDGGVRSPIDDDDINEIEMNILIMDEGVDFDQSEYGMNRYQLLRFQISKQELNDNGFTLETTNTHLKYNGHDYIVDTIKDYSQFSWIGLLECIALRKVHVN